MPITIIYDFVLSATGVSIAKEEDVWEMARDVAWEGLSEVALEGDVRETAREVTWEGLSEVALEGNVREMAFNVEWEGAMGP